MLSAVRYAREERRLDTDESLWWRLWFGCPLSLPFGPFRWEVPDTFTLTTPSSTSTEPPLYKVTLFKGSSTSDEVYVANALLEVVADMEIPRAKEIAKKVKSIGFALVGVWVEEIADAYAEALRDRKLVCDVSKQS